MKIVIAGLMFAAGLLMAPMAVSSAQAASGILQLSGEVVLVDAQAGEIVIESVSDEGDVVSTALSVSDETEVYKGEEPVTIDDVKAGDSVDVSYEVDDSGENVVLEISIQ